MADTREAKHRLREQRQDALREYLSNKCSLEHIIDSIENIEKAAISMKAQELQGKKIALEARLKLLAKYLPDLKNVEMKGDVEHSGGLTITWKS